MDGRLVRRGRGWQAGHAAGQSARGCDLRHGAKRAGRDLGLSVSKTETLDEVVPGFPRVPVRVRLFEGLDDVEGLVPVGLLESFLHELCPEWLLVGTGNAGLGGGHATGVEQVFVEAGLDKILDGLMRLLEVNVALLVREGGVER